MPSKNLIKNGLLELHNLYLGVDGGGTKTHVVLINGDKKVVGEGTDGASNPLRVGIETAVTHILSAVNAACDAGNLNRGDIVAATLGLAGVRREDLRQRVYERFIRDLHIRPVEVCTDAEIALYGATLGKAGLVVIAGTGSVCIGQDDKGKKASAGGWGPLAGDEGGGAGIARRALQAIAKASDGRGKSTKLCEVALDYFRAGRMEDLSVAIYAPHNDNARIAGFARYVIETASGGDAVASGVLNEAAYELALAAKAVIRQLKLEKRKFPIAKVGSIFSAGELITKAFLEQVHEIAPKAFLAEPFLPPGIAAARMAFDNYQKDEFTGN
jgi:N-acetylglucosamine kinase-like BadF-type ATPase